MITPGKRRCVDRNETQKCLPENKSKCNDPVIKEDCKKMCAICTEEKEKKGEGDDEEEYGEEYEE